VSGRYIALTHISKLEWKKMVHEHQFGKCPDCGGEDFFVNRERGEVICKSCAFVIDDAMTDFGRDIIQHENNSQIKGRSGAPFDPRVSNNLMTEVGNYADISKLPKKSQMVLRRIRKKNRWTSSSLEHNLNNSLTTLKIVADNLKMPEVAEKESAVIYRQCAERGITVARPAENIIASCIYISCRLHGLPKTLNEVSDITKVDKKTLGKTYKLISRKLGIKIIPLNPSDFISRFASALGITPKAESASYKMYTKFHKMGLNSGKSPVSLAATSLYLCALINSEKVTQKAMAETSGITETTLRIRCKEMIKTMKLGRQFKGKIAF
jgi:transcription initiation factor TFIIB